MAGLEIKSEGNISRLLNVLLVAANQVPLAYQPEPYGRKLETNRSWAIAEVVDLYAYSGDYNEAKKIAIGSGVDTNRFTIDKIIGTMASFGGKEGISYAKELLLTYKFFNATLIYGDIAKQEAYFGDFDAALKDFNSIPDKDEYDRNNDLYKIYVLCEIAKNQILKGHIDECWKTFLQAENMLDKLELSGTERVNRYVDLVNILIEIAKNQFIKGAKQSCWKTLLQAKAMIDKLDLAEIKKDENYSKLAQIQMNAGDSLNAKISAGYIQDEYWKSKAIKVNEDYWNVSESIKVSDWLDQFTNYSHSLNEPIFVDILAYLKSMTTDNSKYGFENFTLAGYKIISAYNGIDQMLKQQAKQQTKQ
jgi:hypothetical protein